MRWTWVSQFDEGSLASETTRCLRQLGDLERGRQQAERIISLRPSHRTRSRASVNSPCRRCGRAERQG
jgi:hypothetical protein